MLCNVFVAVSTILPVCLCSPPSTLKGRDNLLSLGTPPPAFPLPFFLPRRKSRSERREEKPNNQTSLDKQLINVPSISSHPQSSQSAYSAPTLKRTKILKTPFRNHEAIYRQMSFSSFILFESFKNSLLFYFSLLCFHSQGGQLTGKRVWCYTGGGTAGGGSCYHLMLFFAFQKACKSRRGKKVTL